MTGRISFWLTIIVTLAFCLTARAGDRAELGKVLKQIPPNGPFWKYGNVVMRKNCKQAGMAPVVFAHWSHRSRYTCRVCHQELGFAMRSGDTGITRKEYLAGKYCGACHDGVTAFSVKEGASPQCAQCHMKDTDQLEAKFRKFSASLPLANFGNGIDWAIAIKKGSIHPKNSLKSAQFVMQIPDKLKTPQKLGTTSPRSDVFFSHEDHFAELDCSSCHPDIFNIKRKGTVAFTMEANIFGEFCGACHMQVAFPMNDCRRCHPEISNSAGY